VDPPTNTISSISLFFKPESSSACYNGPRVLLNISAQSSSNFALVKTSEKSYPSKRFGISTFTSSYDDKARFYFSTSIFNFYIARLSPLISFPYFFFINLMKCSSNLLSISYPPKCVSPLVVMTSNTPLSIVNIETSNVPPPKSNTNIFFSPLF